MFDFQTKEPQTNMTQTTHHENCKKQASNPTPDEPETKPHKTHITKVETEEGNTYTSFYRTIYQ